MFWTLISVLEFILIGKLLYDRYLRPSASMTSLTLVQNEDGTFTVEGDATYPIVDGKLHVKVPLDQTSTRNTTTATIALRLFTRAALLGKTAIAETPLPPSLKGIAGALLDDIPQLVNSIMPNPLPSADVSALAIAPPMQPLPEITPSPVIQALTNEE